MKETTICRLCLEPVTNFICTDCLFSDIEKWVLLSNRSDLREALFKKHTQIKEMLTNDENNAFCVICKKEISQIACPCCYLYEMFSVIKSFDTELSRKFENDFNFDLIFHHGFSQLTLLESLHNISSSRRFQPVMIVDQRKKSDINICDNCEQQSEDLVEVNGQWICESCRDVLSF